MQISKRKGFGDELSSEIIHDDFLFDVKRRKSNDSTVLEATSTTCRTREGQKSKPDPVSGSKVNLSVWEKLQIGIAIGLSRENRKQDSIYTSFVETLSHPNFGSYKKIPPRPFESFADARETISDQFGFTHYDNPGAVGGGHLYYVHTASQRLQAVAGARNCRRFMPYRDDLKLAYNGLDAEDPTDTCKETNVRRQLEAACRTNGYRKLEVESLTFKRNDCERRKEMFPELGGQMMGFNDLEINDETGTITLYEADVTSISGVTRTWAWFRVEKPMVVVDGRAPRKLRGLKSWVIIAMPKRQIMHLNAGYSNSTQQLTMSLQLSKDGVPNMICSEKPSELISNFDGPKKFLWVPNMPGTRRGRCRRWWRKFQDLAALDALYWEDLQSNMEKFQCLVEVVSKPGADFMEVSPEKKMHKKKANREY